MLKEHPFTWILIIQGTMALIAVFGWYITDDRNLRFDVHESLLWNIGRSIVGFLIFHIPGIGAMISGVMIFCEIRWSSIDQSRVDNLKKGIHFLPLLLLLLLYYV